MADADLMRRLREAGELIRARAAELAGWSERIPLSGHVDSVREGEVLIVFGSRNAPHARTYEIRGMRHPVFGTAEQEAKALTDGLGHGRGWTWVVSQWRPFLAPAAEQTADEGARRIATVVDDWGRVYGFNE